MTLFPKSPLAELAQTEHGWRARAGEHLIDAATVILAAGGRCYAVAEERGELSTNHPGATGEVTKIALDAGAKRATSTRCSDAVDDEVADPPTPVVLATARTRTVPSRRPACSSASCS